MRYLYPKGKNDFRVYIPIENKKIYFIVIRHKSASIKMLADFAFLPFTFLADAPPLKWRWASLRQAGVISWKFMEFE